MGLLVQHFLMDKLLLVAMINKNLTVRRGIQNSHQHIPKPLKMAVSGALDVSYLAPRRFSLDGWEWGSEVLKTKVDGCLSVVFAP